MDHFFWKIEPNFWNGMSKQNFKMHSRTICMDTLLQLWHYIFQKRMNKCSHLHILSFLTCQQIWFMSHNYCIIQTVSSNGWTAVKSHTHDLWHSTLTLFNVYDVIIKFTTKPFEYPVIMIIQWKNLADFLSANFFYANINHLINKKSVN